MQTKSLIHLSDSEFSDLLKTLGYAISREIMDSQVEISGNKEFKGEYGYLILKGVEAWTTGNYAVEPWNNTLEYHAKARDAELYLGDSRVALTDSQKKKITKNLYKETDLICF